MRLRACLALLCLMLAGCQHLPDGVTIDLENRAVAVGPCRCALPNDAPPEEAGNQTGSGIVSGRAGDNAPE